MASFFSNITDKVRGIFGSGYSTPFSDRSMTDTGAEWNPYLRSTDSDIIGARPYVEARIKDLVQKDGFLAGALDTHCNHVVGDGLKLSLEPDWEALGQTEEWADKFSDAVEAEWKRFINSSRKHADAGRRFNWAALNRQMYLSYLIHGEILYIPKFRRNQEWNTSVMIIDPNRLANPRTEINPDENIRGGVRINENSEPTGYFIYDENPVDGMSKVYRRTKINDYTLVTPYGRTGRKRVGHYFDPVGTEQTRGISLFAPVIDAVKRQHDLSDATLKAAIYQTLVAAVVKSSLNYEAAMGLLGGKREVSDSSGASTSYADSLKAYQENHLSYYNAMRLNLGDLSAIHLLPDEDLEFRNAASINSEYAEFAKTMNREAGRGSMLQLESYTGDYGSLSYSGGQLSNGEAERGHIGRRGRVMIPACQDIFELFMEELLIKKPELLGNSSLNFYDHRDMLCRARWMGPPPVVGDPEKIAKAAQVRLEHRITTKEHEATQIGMDWREMLKQQAKEKKLSDELGIEDAKVEQLRIQQENKDVGGSSSDGDE